MKKLILSLVLVLLSAGCSAHINAKAKVDNASNQKETFIYYRVTVESNSTYPDKVWLSREKPHHSMHITSIDFIDYETGLTVWVQGNSYIQELEGTRDN